MYIYDQLKEGGFFLLKTINSAYYESTINGELCFNIPEVFNRNEKLKSAQIDKYDSHMQINIKDVVYAPIDKTNNTIKYGSVKKLCDSGLLRTIALENKKCPICCFRKIDIEDAFEENGGKLCSIKLGHDTVDRIRNEFGHDKFILILNVEEFINRIKSKKKIVYNDVYYGYSNEEYLKYLDQPPFCLQKEMFNKANEYKWQKEYRIVICEEIDDKRILLDIGDIHDIVICGDIENLSSGYAFGLSIEDFK